MRKARLFVLAGLLLPALAFISLPQDVTVYVGKNTTGQLHLVRQVNLFQQAQGPLGAKARALALAKRRLSTQELPKSVPHTLYQPFFDYLRPLGARPRLSIAAQQQQTLNIVTGSATREFNGVTHYDQRNANQGNQFSIEPPSPSIAVAHGFVLEGVNNAVQVYDTSGNPLLPTVVSTNQLFGVAPAIDRNTGVNGVYPTDMRVFYDRDIDRWFVLQRSHDNDADGNLLPLSHLYLAVSATSDPTGTYNIYVADTTDADNRACPCILDYPQIGADRYAFVISADEYNVDEISFVQSNIMALSKAALASGEADPAMFTFPLPISTGYEFAIQPATTPPGASYFLGNGGQEYLVSTTHTAVGSGFAVWALSNTSSLSTSLANPRLTMTMVPTQFYSVPDVAREPDGPHPYGESLDPNSGVPFIDGGDTRVQSLSYAVGRLYVTLGTSASDGTNSVVGGMYAVLSPVVRAGQFTVSVLTQGYLAVKDNDLLRPAIAVNAQGKGVIAVTLVGPNRYPSAAFIPFETFKAPTTIRVAGIGTLPEDGFTGYTDFGFPIDARWGDYSGAVAASDGSIWTVAEYIADLPRTELANWDTFIMQSVP